MKKRVLNACFGFSLLFASQISAYHGEDNDPFSIDAYTIWLAPQKVNCKEFDMNNDGRVHHRFHRRDGCNDFDHHDRDRDRIHDFDHHDKHKFHPCQTGLDGTKVTFGEAHIGLTYHYLCSGCCEEYLLGGGYTYTRLQWRENPFFEQQNYNTANVDLGFWWGCICDWDFRGFARIYLDTDSPNPDQYMYFDFTLWGRLQHRENLGINVGALIFTGMKVNRGYPIFGIDWQPTDFLEINLVYPTDMSIVFHLNDSFSASVGGRLIYSRHRVQEQDRFDDFNSCNFSAPFIDYSHASQYFSNGLPFIIPVLSDFPPENFPMYLNPRSFARAVWEYRAWGIEGALDYDCGNVNINVFAGYSFWNKLTIGAHSFNHKQTFKLEPTPYLGAEFLIRF